MDDSDNYTQTEYQVLDSPYNVLHATLCTVGILAELVVLTVMLMYKQLRTPTNLYILNWCLINAIFLLSQAYLYATSVTIPSFSFDTDHTLKVMVRFSVAIILTLLTFDYCVQDKVYTQRVNILLWFFIVTCAIMSYRWKLLAYFNVVQLVSHASMIVSYVVNIILHQAKRSEAGYRSRKLRLTLLSTYAFLWLSGTLTFYVVTTWLDDLSLLLVAVVVIETGTALTVALSHLYVLVHLDERFRISLVALFKCNSAHDVENSVPFDEDKSDVEINSNGNCHRVTFTLE